MPQSTTVTRPHLTAACLLLLGLTACGSPTPRPGAADPTGHTVTLTADGEALADITVRIRGQADRTIPAVSLPWHTDLSVPGPWPEVVLQVRSVGTVGWVSCAEALDGRPWAHSRRVDGPYAQAVCYPNA